ncbi:MAG: hypothetical protein B6D68_01890 [spirochete symbiont of Stewartia floridana]|nr:MAG: hypothetical protein B6D68_01890 [spirochete symbiont of Stewartia floridana]
MGVFSRLGDIINSNINSLLEKAENPEKMIRLMLQEIEDTLVDLKSSCATKMATKAEMTRSRNSLEAKINRWQQRAKLAVENKRDDLAKEALLEKRRCMNQLEFAEKDLRHFTQMIDECRSNIEQLEQKFEEVRQKHKILVQRGVHAAEKKRARVAASSTRDTRTIARFQELENKIEMMEADADLTGPSKDANLEREFERLESDSLIEVELAALKKSVDKTASKGSKKEEKVAQGVV